MNFGNLLSDEEKKDLKRITEASQKLKNAVGLFIKYLEQNPDSADFVQEELAEEREVAVNAGVSDKKISKITKTLDEKFSFEPENLLTHEEVDKLLSSVASGEIDTEETEEPTGETETESTEEQIEEAFELISIPEEPEEELGETNINEEKQKTGADIIEAEIEELMRKVESGEIEFEEDDREEYEPDTDSAIEVDFILVDDNEPSAPEYPLIVVSKTPWFKIPKPKLGFWAYFCIIWIAIIAISIVNELGIIE